MKSPTKDQTEGKFALKTPFHLKIKNKMFL